ncbi:hypothetical protein B0H11DRAFT_2263208 [Mycena galericulata]|nr:hypothetical protein B0H11DRAFT_2263208 [Mycena galericulata]
MGTSAANVPFATRDTSVPAGSKHARAGGEIALDVGVKLVVVFLDAGKRRTPRSTPMNGQNRGRGGRTGRGWGGSPSRCSTFGDESEFVQFSCQVHPNARSLLPIPSVRFPFRSKALLANQVLLSFSPENATTYRPTNEDCLMRIVTTRLWLKLLRDVNRIDAIEESRNRAFRILMRPRRSRRSLRLVPLAQSRTAAVAGFDDSYTVTWSKDGVVLRE